MKILFALSFLFLGSLSLPSSSANESRTVFVVWDEFVKTSNSGADHVTNVQTYLKNCLKESVSPEEFYSVSTIKELTIAESEFRKSADSLHELRMRLEHPLPKGTMTAKK